MGTGYGLFLIIPSYGLLSTYWTQDTTSGEIDAWIELMLLLRSK